MATRGRSGLGVAVLGSVATEVVCRSQRPLVLVGPSCRTAMLPGERGRVLMTSDGSEFSNGILPTASSWAHRLQLTPGLTEVVGPDEDPEPAHRRHPNREIEAAVDRLRDLATRFDARSARPDVEVLHGDPARSIASLAERLPAGMIISATHGRSGLTRIALGSVANDVVRHAPCPVLVERPIVGSGGES